MLFYNHKQEFIGIDEEGLKLLNYATLEDILGVCSDVADLFAKEPGYIHNFKNFGWIDFLLHADSDATSAIVHGNGRTFTCTLNVQKLFMVENPSSHGYIIDMTHIKSLSGEEIKPHVISPKPSFEGVSEVPEQPAHEVQTAPSPLPDYTYLTPTVLSEPDTLDIPSYTEEEFPAKLEPIDDLYAKLSLPSKEELLHEEVSPEEEILPQKEIPVSTPVVPSALPIRGGIRYSDAEQTFIKNLKIPESYRFDPRIAANELGLPVDLIQEFIGDFIQQAHDFKEELFEAALKGDMNNLKILSHKLKGVAANLRIEDAFETLTNINTSDDPTEIDANLKYFYSIVAKLENKEESISENTDAPTIPSLREQNDIYTFDLKQNSDEPLLVHEEELYTSPDESFKSVFESDEPQSMREEELYPYPDEPFKSVPDESSLTHEEELYPFPEMPEEPFISESHIADETQDKLHFDTGAIAGALGIELPFFEEILKDYKRDATNAAERISGAISAFDTHSWKKTASDLKGISDNLRLSEISDVLAVLSQTNDAQEAHKASKRLIGFIAQL